MLRSRAQVLSDEIAAHGYRAVVGCSGGDLLDIPVAVRAARMAGVPAFCYYFDDYRLQWQARGLFWSGRSQARLASWVESEALEAASGAIAPSELLADDVRQRTRTPVHVVHNPVDWDLYARIRTQVTRLKRATDQEKRVVYTGAVYEAPTDALRNGALAVELLREQGHRVSMHVYTHDSLRRQRMCGLPPSVVSHKAVSDDEAAVIQCSADILFLPLGFHTKYPELIRTSSPLKFGEYLASGRPVLVNAPADSFVSAVSRQYGCAALCATPDPLRLIESLVVSTGHCNTVPNHRRWRLEAERLPRPAVEPSRHAVEFGLREA